MVTATGELALLLAQSPGLHGLVENVEELFRQHPGKHGGCPIFLFIETAILREKNINIRETFANPVFFFRGGSPCHETI